MTAPRATGRDGRMGLERTIRPLPRREPKAGKRSPRPVSPRWAKKAHPPPPRAGRRTRRRKAKAGRRAQEQTYSRHTGQLQQQGGGCTGRGAAARAGGLFAKRPGEKPFAPLRRGRSAAGGGTGKVRKSVRRHHGPGGGRAGGRQKPGGGRGSRRVRATRGSCKSRDAFPTDATPSEKGSKPGHRKPDRRKKGRGRYARTGEKRRLVWVTVPKIIALPKK